LITSNEAQSDLDLQGILKLSGASTSCITTARPTTNRQAERDPDESRHPLPGPGLINISEGATITCQMPAKRYMSLMIINNNGYVNNVYYGGGFVQVDN